LARTGPSAGMRAVPRAQMEMVQIHSRPDILDSKGCQRMPPYEIKREALAILFIFINELPLIL